MQNKNICKFVPAIYSESISFSCFVLETDKKAMKTKQKLNGYRLILVLEGKGNFKFDKTQVEFTKGMLLFGFKEEQVVACCEDESKYMYIDFSGIRADELIKRFNISKGNRIFTGFDGLIPLWKESLLRASKNTVDLAAESMLLYTLSRFDSDFIERDNIISKILQITETQFNNFDLSIAAIANELGYNPKYISHLFKEKMNIGYSEYLRNVRIKYAVSLFEHGLDSIKNVALLSGFSDPLYFSTVFKKSMGVSPKEYVSSLPQKSK